MNDFQFFLNWLSENPYLAFFLLLVIVNGLGRVVYYITHRNEKEEDDD